ncbi:MAG: hypothetical protein EYC70_17005 [Planctomycetota bacterium]|nr:MAG: hypothetical protein EYC70_17005 [Planctomycetota bacterium]
MTAASVQTSDPPQRARLDLPAFGLRAGLAAGLLMLGLGLATPGRFDVLAHPLLRVLFFLFPLAWYGFIGLVLGVAAAGLARLLERFAGAARWPRPALAAALLVASLGYVGSIWQRALPKTDSGRIWMLAACALLTVAVLAVPLARRPPGSRRLLWGGSLVIALGLGLTAYWIGSARSIVHGAAPQPPADSADKPNLVLITWDTVRADMLPLYGGAGLESPQLERLASQGVVFDQMLAVAPITGPAHASLLTGVMPPTHGLRSNGDTTMSAGVPTLAQALRANGYDTAAFVAAFPVRGQFGFARGFRVYDDRLGGEGIADRMVDFQPIDPYTVAKLQKLLLRAADSDRMEAAIEGARVLERAQEYLAQAQAPFFLWLHFYDAHGPHDPAPPYLAKAEALAAGARPQPVDPARSATNMLGQRAEIMELDAYLGQVLAALDACDPGLQRTAVLLIADHGECFGEGGYVNTHAPSLYEATQRIPAVLRLPDGSGGGRRVADLASQIDVTPTFLELAGLKAMPGVQGVSLLPAARGSGPLAQRPLFARGMYMEAMLQRMQEGEHKYGLRDAEWKFLQGAEDPGWTRLFRLSEGEDADQSAQHPEVAARMRAALAQMLEDMPRSEDTSRALSDSEWKSLAELGYADGQEEEQP